MQTLTIHTELRTQLIDITKQIREIAAREPARLATVFVPHTTAGIVVRASGNGASKVAAGAALTASSVSIPVVDGSIVLGGNQSVFLAEFDGKRDRDVHVVMSS